MNVQNCKYICYFYAYLKWNFHFKKFRAIINPTGTFSIAATLLIVVVIHISFIYAKRKYVFSNDTIVNWLIIYESNKLQ